MNQIKDPPLNSDFGYTFNYALWSAGTRVSLVNVQWNNDFRDVCRFADRDALNAYITSRENADYVFTDLAYAKAGEPIRIDLPFEAVYRFNYLRASNPAQPVPGPPVQKDFYYFITDVQYIAPNTTEIVVQLDVFQTFIYDVTFGMSYIDRGHIGIANENAFDAFGREYLTVPEGLDVGAEYQVITKRNEPIMAIAALPSGEDVNSKHNILVISTIDITADPGDADAPVVNTATGGNYQGLPSGASYYIFENASQLEWFMQWGSTRPWVTQGIISITMIPDIRRYLPDFEFTMTADGGPAEMFPVNDVDELPPGILPPKKYGLFDNWRANDEILDNIPTRYRHLLKFLTFPYMVLELTMFNATPIILKPENWKDADATVVEKIALPQPNQRVAISPFKYNAKDPTKVDNLWPGVEDIDDFGGLFFDGGDDYGDWIDVATVLSGFPTTMIVNNSGIAYIAANARSLAFQNQAAGWQQSRALRGNQVAYDQASGGMQTARALTDIGNTIDYSATMTGNANLYNQAGINAIGGIIGGTSQGAMAGAAAGPHGAAIGAGMAAVGSTVGSIFNALSTDAQANTNAQLQAIRALGATAGNAIQNKQSGLVRDTNRSLADWAARGDYENTIAGINAKVQDAQTVGPSVIGQAGGDILNFVNNHMFLSLRFKMIDLAAIRVIGDYWLRYGYAVRRFGIIPADLKVMTKFTYWKLLETYIVSAAMPEGFKQAIRGIFEKGVTVWSDPDDIGNIDIADNAPLEGITL